MLKRQMVLFGSHFGKTIIKPQIMTDNHIIFAKIDKISHNHLQISRPDNDRVVLNDEEVRFLEPFRYESLNQAKSES